MNKKILISIIVVLILVVGFFILLKPSPENKCGDGVCSSIEKQKGNCLIDCKTSNTPISCPQYTPPAPRWCSDGIIVAGEVDKYECQGPPKCVIEAIPSSNYDNIIPFGIHPGTPVEYVNDIGIKWIRGGGTPYFFWALVDPDMSGDNFQWSGRTDKGSYNYDVLSFVEENELSMLINIGVDPPRQTSHTNKGSFLPKDKEAYSNFVKAAVNKYPYIKYWQIGNEPVANLNDYGEYVCLTYEAIKEVNPNIKVLLGGAAGLNRDPDDFSVYQNNFNKAFFPLLEDLSLQNKRCFDIFDFHYFGLAGDDYLMVRDVYNHISGKINGLNMPAPEEYWITEDGTYSGDPKLKAGAGKERKDPPYQSEEEQAISLIKRFIYPTTFGIKKVFWAWGIKEGFHHDDSYFDFTGLVYDGEYDYDLGNGVKKLSYYAYKNMVEVLDGSDWNNIEKVKENSNGVYAYKFNNQGKDIWVVWNDNANTQAVTLEIGRASCRERV